MPNRYNEGLFTNEGVRQLFLLKILYNSAERRTIEELSLRMSLDRRSIYKTVDQINETLQNNKRSSRIEVSSRGEYSFTGNKIDYYRLQGYIVSQEPMTHLAKDFLVNKSVDFYQFCQDNFLSESTLRRYLRKVNQLITPLGLRLSVRKNKIHFLGNEARIRYGLVTFFWRYYHGVTWPFETVDEEKIHHIFSNMFTSLETISYGKRLQLYYYWIISMLRGQAGMEISKEEVPDYFEPLLSDNPAFKIFSERYGKAFPLSDKEIKFAFYLLYIFPDSYKYIQNTSQTLDTLKKYAPKSYDSIRDFLAFVQEIHPKFNILSDEKAEFVAMLIAGRLFVDTFGEIYFNSSSISIVTYAAKQYPNFIPSIQKQIQMKEPELSPNALKGLTLRFGQAYVMAFSPRDFETKVTILLTTDLPLYVDKIMYERLEALLSPRFNYEWITLDKKQRPDLLLSTGPIDEKFLNVPKLFINAQITKKDKEAILKACEQIVIEKEMIQKN